MNRRSLLLAAVVVFGFAIWAIIAQRSSEIGTQPPLAGWMKNFIPTPDAGPAPQMPLVAEDGKVSRLADFGGRLVLVNFWATWCAPCVREMPSLLRLHKARGDKDFTVLAISQDLRGWPVITPFLTRLGLDGLPVLHDHKGALSRAFGVQGLPTTILLGRDGREIGRLTGVAEWDRQETGALIDFYAKK
ncbi:MAG: TlpA disulfide reductase family protein [Alphaproteobacteria bacterium]